MEVNLVFCLRTCDAHYNIVFDGRGSMKYWTITLSLDKDSKCVIVIEDVMLML